MLKIQNEQIKIALFFAFFCMCYRCADAADSGSSLLYIESANGSRSSDRFEVIRNTHARVVFDKEIERIAVGNTAIMEMEVLAGREVLMIGKEIGKTSVIIWYTDNTAEPLMFDVTEDLTMLVGVLRDIHADIVLEMAPDRAALILRGTVPSIQVKMAAENAARSYLSSDTSRTADIFSPGTTVSEDERIVSSRIAIINLIKTVESSLTVEERIKDFIGESSPDVTIRRVMRGQVPDDMLDTFLLEGEVTNQVELTRVLRFAGSIVTGDEDNEITVVSDESGGLSGSSSGAVLGANVARAKMLSAAGGRILSTINVKNIPQVRVAVKIHEINRSRLKNWKPDLTAVSDNYISRAQTNSQPNPQPSPFSVRDIDVANALQVLNGTLTNNVQVATQDIAFDLLFAMLEEEGISRVLSNPTITVLSGETALFEVGGQIPVPSSFSPVSSGVVTEQGQQQQQSMAPGTYSNVEFKRYGVTLRVFPLVDENNLITLDISPEISQPDISLTRQITQATGSSAQTTSFNTRSLQTRAQVRDGQPMVIGGLITRSSSQTDGYLPGIGNFPGIGSVVGDSSRSEVATELVIVVTPTVVQQSLDDNGLWQHEDLFTLLESAVGRPGLESLPSMLRRSEMFDEN